MAMESSENDTLLELVADFPEYAKRCLNIRTKRGEITRLELNKAQQYIHAKLEEQKARTGRVRAIIVKGRQQGCSTYVGGRFYNLVTCNRGYQAFILTHESEATSNLFNMTRRYHEDMHPVFKPTTSSDSSKELVFDKISSGYKVGTAGNSKTGRGSTIQLFHGSEVAFWENEQQIVSGILQAVPDEVGTEVILESTANGVGNLFYTRAMEAMRGDSDYQLIFVPWHWQDEYRKPLPKDFKHTAEELALARAYELDNEQIYWRRLKVLELGSEWLFKQEYPFTAIEAFQVSGEDSFISPELVFDARHRDLQIDNYAPLVVGVDPARFGDDRTAIVWRRGRIITKIKTFKHIDTMELAGKVAMIIRDESPDKVFVDVGGLGAGVYDRLAELGHKRVVVDVNAGSRPTDGDRYKNKRAEMWGNMKEWLAEGSIPDSDELQADLIGVSYKYDSMTRLQLESKDDMKKRGIKSPDIGDAIALTFALPVVRRDVRAQRPRRARKQKHFMEW